MLIGATLTAGVSLIGLETAAVASAGTGGMNINATGGDGSHVDADGTQGSIISAVQGTNRGSTDQAAYENSSEDYVPQFKASPSHK